MSENGSRPSRHASRKARVELSSSTIDIEQKKVCKDWYEKYIGHGGINYVLKQNIISKVVWLMNGHGNCFYWK